MCWSVKGKLFERRGCKVTCLKLVLIKFKATEHPAWYNSNLNKIRVVALKTIIRTTTTTTTTTKDNMTTFNFKTIQTSLFTAAAIVLTAPAWAATDGMFDATSSGSVDISLTIADKVKISNLSDIALTDDGNGNFVGTSTACVYRNGSGAYSMTATGSGTASAFTIAEGGGGGATLAYAVTYDDGGGAEALTASVALGSLADANTTEDDCSTAGNNGTVSVNVASADASSAVAGAYVGTLTLVVAPE